MMKPATSSSSSLFRASMFFHLLLLAILFTGGKSGEVKCNDNDIVITQGEGSPQFNGVPTYIVEITNQCRTGCRISDLRLKCGRFSSDKSINPWVFKRLPFDDDCLVNGGRAIPPGSAISFQYATTFKFPLSVSSFKCFE